MEKISGPLSSAMATEATRPRAPWARPVAVVAAGALVSEAAMKINSVDKDVKAILGYNYYCIPRFQRPYSWLREHISDYWYDTIAESAGDYFIAASSNNRIRKVTVSTGVITTVALVPSPTGLEVDSQGNLYVADPQSHKVRKVAGVAAATALPTPTPTPIPGAQAMGLAAMAVLMAVLLLWRTRRRTIH